MRLPAGAHRAFPPVAGTGWMTTPAFLSRCFSLGVGITRGLHIAFPSVAQTVGYLLTMPVPTSQHPLEVRDPKACYFLSFLPFHLWHEQVEYSVKLLLPSSPTPCIPPSWRSLTQGRLGFDLFARVLLCFCASFALSHLCQLEQVCCQRADFLP